MLKNDRTIKLGSKVAYTSDPRVTGIVVGHGTVNNAFDPTADGDESYHVAIVRLDQANWFGAGPANLNFHMPFSPSVLTVI